MRNRLALAVPAARPATALSRHVAQLLRALVAEHFTPGLTP
jgi:hypothetical protein